MNVYLIEIEYHYFMIGALAVAYLSPPILADETHNVRSINILRDEVIQELGENRYLIQKKI